jgi:5'-deoxynucleotidase YfbR-like HD superfamily hydrolase
MNGPLVNEEEANEIKQLYLSNPELMNQPYGFHKGRKYYSSIPWIQTFLGIRFNPTHPIVDNIEIEDIAHSLSMQCRFVGHLPVFYSVAQHAYLSSFLVNDPKLSLSALLHDGSEAYLADMSRPLKRSGVMQGYLDLEKKMQAAIYTKFGLPIEIPQEVIDADNIMLMTELRDFMNLSEDEDKSTVIQPHPFTIKPVDQNTAKLQFLKRFYDLKSLLSE